MIFIVTAKTKEGNFGASFTNSAEMRKWLTRKRLFYGLYEYTVREL